METHKQQKNKEGRIFLISIFLLFVIMFARHEIKRIERSRTLGHIIANLEQYKLEHGSYPTTIPEAEVNDWLYYYVDSTRHLFTLSYSKGIMDCNTVSYNGNTKKWETIFNY